MNIKKEAQDHLEEDNDESLNSFENDPMEDAGWENFDTYNDNDQEYYGFDGKGLGVDEDYENFDNEPMPSEKIKRKRKGKKGGSASSLSKKVHSHSKISFMGKLTHIEIVAVHLYHYVVNKIFAPKTVRLKLSSITILQYF